MLDITSCNDESDDLEDQMDRTAERFPNGEDPMMTTKELDLTFEAQIEKIPAGVGIDFENWCEKYGFTPLNGWRRAWCSSLGTYMRDADYLVTLIGLSDCPSFFMTEDEIKQSNLT